MTSKSRLRRFLGNKFSSVVYDLITIHNCDYMNYFLQFSTDPLKRENFGLQKIFNEIFLTKDTKSNFSLDFLYYHFENPQRSAKECMEFDSTYSVLLKACFRLSLFEVDNDLGTENLIDVKEEKDVFVCEIPIPDTAGAFIINGTKKVVVSQIHRAPGVFFDHDGGKSNAASKLMYSAKVIPYRGSWLDLEFDAADLMYFRIDKKRKLPITTLLRAIGMNADDILHAFYSSYTLERVDSETWIRDLPLDNIFAKHKLRHDIIDVNSKKVLYASGEYFSKQDAHYIIKVIRKFVSLKLTC